MAAESHLQIGNSNHGRMLFFIIIVVVFEIVIYDSRANIALDVDACGIGFGQTASVSTANHVMIAGN